MAMLERNLTGNFSQVLDRLHSGVLDSNISATYEDGSDFRIGNVYCAVRMYERYSWFGGNRVAMSLTLVGDGDRHHRRREPGDVLQAQYSGRRILSGYAGPGGGQPVRQGGGAMEWWKAPNWEGPERNALRDERRREHWWERQEDERYRLDWGDLVGEALELLLDMIDAIT